MMIDESGRKVVRMRMQRNRERGDFNYTYASTQHGETQREREETDVKLVPRMKAREVRGL
jgi:hypothetical protein